MSDQEGLREQNVAVVRRFLDAIDRRDTDVIAELYDDDVHKELPFAPEPYPRESFGKETVIAFSKGVSHRIESLNLYEVVIDTLAGDPGRLIATYKSDTTVKPAMTPYRNRYVAAFTVRDGKIIYFGEYFDPIALVEAFADTAAPDQNA